MKASGYTLRAAEKYALIATRINDVGKKYALVGTRIIYFEWGRQEERLEGHHWLKSVNDDNDPFQYPTS